MIYFGCTCLLSSSDPSLPCGWWKCTTLAICVAIEQRQQPLPLGTVHSLAMTLSCRGVFAPAWRGQSSTLPLLPTSNISNSRILN